MDKAPPVHARGALFPRLPCRPAKLRPHPSTPERQPQLTQPPQREGGCLSHCSVTPDVM